MKILFVLSTIIVLSNALNQAFKDQFMEKIMEYATKCIEEVHASDDDIAELINRKIPPTSHEAKCLLFCMHKSFNLMTADGKFNREGALKTLEPLKEADENLYDTSIKVFDICSESTEINEDPCITISNWVECGLKEGKNLGISDDIFKM